jgi:hypothetical protein
MRKGLYAGFLFLVMVVFSACSEDSVQVDSDNLINDGVNVSTMVKKNLCELLPASKITEITNIEYTTVKQSFEKERATLADCLYMGEKGESVNIIVNFDSPAYSAKQQFEDLKTSMRKNKELDMVAGVGEEAFFSATQIITQINSLNKNAWLTMAVYVDGDEEEGKQAAIKIANAVWNAL